MPDHDLIVIGGSKGAGFALAQIAAALPGALPAAVFIVIHHPAFPAGYLPEILERSGPLPAAYAVHGEAIRRGRIYVAPGIRQLHIELGRVSLHRDLQWCAGRPRIDVVFRTAAQVYGPRVVGVVMSGLLDDGARGLAAIKGCGGVAIVQDPGDATEPSMPRHALDQVDVDHCVPAAELAPLLVRLAHGRIDPIRDRQGNGLARRAGPG